jgi:hypothetical protein
VIALTPFAVLAADTSAGHVQDELANGEAQWVLANQTVADLESQANLSAQNERMIALLKSQAARERQLSLTSNANAMEEIAAALANAARASGDVTARNDLGIAQIKAAGLVSVADANLANAMAIGRVDEVLNARAQWNIMHQLADLISGQLAEANISNDKLIAQAQADAIHTPALAQQQNGLAMGANELLAADTALAAGQVNAFSATLSVQTKTSAILDHAAASLKNAKAMAGVQ